MASTNPLHPKDQRPIAFQGNVPVDLPARTPYELRPSLPIDGWPSLLRYSITQVLNPWYGNIEPVSHHLRLSASAKGPTNPERTNLPQETLGFRR